MRPRILHIVVSLLMALLYVSERALPCGDACQVACAAEVGAGQSADHLQQTLEAAHDQQGGDHAGDSHHCSHCICPCHAPVVTAGETAWISVPVPLERHAPPIHLPQSAQIDPVDHVPLA